MSVVARAQIIRSRRYGNGSRRHGSHGKNADHGYVDVGLCDGRRGSSLLHNGSARVQRHVGALYLTWTDCKVYRNRTLSEDRAVDVLILGTKTRTATPLSRPCFQNKRHKEFGNNPDEVFSTPPTETRHDSNFKLQNV